MAVAGLALFVALSGTGYAVSRIPNDSVGNAQLRKGAVSSSKVRDESLLAKDFRPGQLPRGAKGAKGEKGEPGLIGPPGAFQVVGADGKELGTYLGWDGSYYWVWSSGLKGIFLLAPSVGLLNYPQPTNNYWLYEQAECAGSTYVDSPTAGTGYALPEQLWAGPDSDRLYHTGTRKEFYPLSYRLVRPPASPGPCVAGNPLNTPGSAAVKASVMPLSDAGAKPAVKRGDQISLRPAS